MKELKECYHTDKISGMLAFSSSTYLQIMFYYTIMDFSAGVYDAVCTRKNNIDRGGSRGQYFFLLHFTSFTPAEKTINVLLYN